MRRMHVIEDFDRMGGEIYFREDKERYMRDPELREAFEAGCEHGYHKAHKEMGEYGERRHYPVEDIIRYRHEDEWDDDDMYDERRRRSRRTGRYI